MSIRELVIEGARQNNLKGINLRLPHDKVIAVTGVSGSGKSSLAFETIFAEGQWRFIESLSTYARLFLEKMDRPLVDSIENIRPAVALEQRNPARGSRSTVGTLTELYDLFRLLYSKVATPFCPKCGREIRKWDASGIASELLSEYAGKRAVILFETEESVGELKKKGFYRAWVNGEALEFEEAGTLPPKKDVVVDRLVIKDEPRLADSIETAWGHGPLRGATSPHDRHGGRKVKVAIIDGPTLTFTARNACDYCEIGAASPREIGATSPREMELPEPTPLLFSFNHPVGACPECKGFGNILKYSETLVVPDPYLSLAEGAVEPWEKPSYRWWKRQMQAGAKKAGVDMHKPYRELSKKDREWLFKGGSGMYGLNDFFEELERKRYKLHVRVFLARYREAFTCPACGGNRLGPGALAYKLSGKDIAGLSALSVSMAVKFFKEIDLTPFQRDMVKELLRQVSFKLQYLQRVGLDYLSLSRQGRTLSGGEYQRVNLSNQLGAALTGTLYVLDEPTVGLHRRDTERVTGIMSELSAGGNTIVVVEHDKTVIEAADWVVELGPGGGRLGGEVVFSGPMAEFLKTDTLTARYIKGIDRLTPPIGHRPEKRRKEAGVFSILGATGNNLKSVDLDIPLETFTCITGVSGSGKSTLIVDTLYKALAKHFMLMPEPPQAYRKMQGLEHLKGVRLIDQTPIGKTPRSNPATYLKLFDPIRKLFSAQPEAMARGHGPGFFSFNVPGGRCETCRGEGYQKVEMYFFEDLYIKCEECGGKRYGPEALKITYHGKNIYDVLDMTVDEAAGHFSGSTPLMLRLDLLREVGLGYLRLGQPATSLSGGEAQRLKICAELGLKPMRDFLYILDEPTVGLHARDVKALLLVLQRLVDAGNTVVVIEHNLDLVAASDRVIDLGPEGGEAGGRIIASGTPEELTRVEGSYTGRYLREYLD